MENMQIHQPPLPIILEVENLKNYDTIITNLESNDSIKINFIQGKPDEDMAYKIALIRFIGDTGTDIKDTVQFVAFGNTKLSITELSEKHHERDQKNMINITIKEKPVEMSLIFFTLKAKKKVWVTMFIAQTIKKSELKKEGLWKE